MSTAIVNSIKMKNTNGDSVVVYPRTTLSAITDSEGKTLDVVLEELESSIASATDGVQEQLNDKLNLSGGTMTGTLTSQHISPSTALSCNIGYSSKPFGQVFAKKIYVGTGGAATGGIYVNKEGTETVNGDTIISIGNGIASGTLHNSKGYFRLYGSNNKYTQIASNDTLTSDVKLTLPSVSGTLALVSDISSASNCLSLSGGTMAGNLMSQNIIPTSASTYNLGSTSNPYKNIYTQNQYLTYDNVDYGRFYISTIGTTDKVGTTYCILGNGIASGNANNSCGYIRMYGKSSGYTQIQSSNDTETNITVWLPSTGGTLALFSDLSTRLSLSGGTMYGALATQDITPRVDNTHMLGSSDYRWNSVYSGAGVITTSDRTQKTNITDLDEERSKSFIMGLKPSSYKFIDGTSDRTHYGLVAQDVEELMTDLGMTSQDFAGFIKSQKQIMIEETTEGGEIISSLQDVEGEYNYSLRYDEFIAPIIKTIQCQQNKIDELMREITTLKELVLDASTE